MLVHVGHIVVILLSLCCHFGALDEWHGVVMLLSCWCMLVIVLSFCWHVVVILVHWMIVHGVGIVLRMLVHVGHVVAIVLWLCCHCGALDDCHVVVMLLSCWCILVIVLSFCWHAVVILVHWMIAMVLALS